MKATCVIAGCSNPTGENYLDFCNKHGSMLRCHREGCDKPAGPNYTLFCDEHGKTDAACGYVGCTSTVGPKYRFSCDKHGGGNTREYWRFGRTKDAELLPLDLPHRGPGFCLRPVCDNLSGPVYKHFCDDHGEGSEKRIPDPPPVGKSPASPYVEAGIRIGNLITEKQAAYGDSFGKSGQIMRVLYPEGIPIEKMDDALTIVRVIDKLFRIATHRDALGENPWQDIAGYAMLSVERQKGAKK